MTVASRIHPRPMDIAAPSAHARWPHLAGLGVALPPLVWPQAQVCEEIARELNLQGLQLERWRRIVAGSGVVQRGGVLHPCQVLPMSTAQRMAAYEQHAPGLAIAAAGDALHTAGCEAEEITDLIVVSCTGFSSPGVDVQLVKTLGLRRDVRRTLIGFMGCFGAINGLRAAIGACCMAPDALALVVCVELCSLHARRDADPANLVASALFGDGAAAAIVSSNPTGFARGERQIRLMPGRGFLMPRLESAMSWRITDHGFAMTLDRALPAALIHELPSLVKQAQGDTEPACLLVHPGGPGILDAVETALGLEGPQSLRHSRRVLGRHGNMSSGTILFVLREALAQACELPAMLLAFGPGLSVETLPLVQA